ncbi:hypothetical protein Cch01nite_43740 [Cellulomonas chitinilytica]|uniref:Class F sortase n=1 Tax=Cellulomonas chitinilytica TaxID=398759 RepID=A0A919P6J0_9CELL|nr:class F sortase [Cellulomonas chitinilytica]GIG23650.1 hypothetical protein Cch01nite_43740 [Cellulomonas chitinilytica]
MAPRTAARLCARLFVVVLVGTSTAALTGCTGQRSDPDPVVVVSSPASTRRPSPVEPPAPVPVHDAALGAQRPPVAAPAPVRLVVPDARIDMPVDAVGVQDDGQMQIPEDADRAGWYRFGPAPGDPAGTTVLAGHVDSRLSGVGQLARLREVGVGATLTVSTVDGKDHAYRVVDVQRVPKEAAPVDLWFDRTGPPRLVVVTCGGTFRRDTGHYADNVVVTAEPLGGQP